MAPTTSPTAVAQCGYQYRPHSHAHTHAHSHFQLPAGDRAESCVYLMTFMCLVCHLSAYLSCHKAIWLKRKKPPANSQAKQLQLSLSLPLFLCLSLYLSLWLLAWTNSFPIKLQSEAQMLLLILHRPTFIFGNRNKNREGPVHNSSVNRKWEWTRAQQRK